MSIPLKPGQYLLPGPVGLLEVAIEVPASAVPDRVALLCHPHPLHGGTMHNKVVTTMARACLGANLISVRFNYRGVGNSAGEYDHARGECLDALAVANWLRESLPGVRFLIGGFSFGAYIAYQIHDTLACWELWLIAPPVEHLDFSAKPLATPTTVVVAEADEVCSPSAIHAWLATQGAQVKCESFPGASHFFHGQLVALRRSLQSRLICN